MKAFPLREVDMRRTASFILAGFFVSTAALATEIGPDMQRPDLWRGSKLTGVRIYGPDDRNVGKITDVLMSKDGRAQYIIVGVGGFLGIGQKDVSIPYDQVVFTDEPVKAPPSTMGGSQSTAVVPQADLAAAPGSNSPGTGGVPTSTALGAPSDMDAGALPPKSTSYPDHGRISLTFDQLKNAPDFHFAK